MKPFVDSADVSADVKPSGTPQEGEDLTEDIRHKARELGFGEVGFTQVRPPLCLRMQAQLGKVSPRHLPGDGARLRPDPEPSSLEAEHAHYGTYELESERGGRLAELIRNKGYHAQLHSPRDPSAAVIPMFVAAGLGQLGANGQLLSPHFGSRARLMMITTDAPVKYDEPVDYGIHAFCQKWLGMRGTLPRTSPRQR